MIAFGRAARRLAAAGLLAAGVLFVPGAMPRTRPAAATAALSLFAAPSIDGQGVVLNWSLTVLTLNAQSFVLVRRAALIAGDPGAPIYIAGNAVRGYTDYGLPFAGWYCYTLTALQPGMPGDVSPETCAAFIPGVPGTARPIIGAGCNRFYEALPAGTSMQAIAARFDPAAAVVSLWRYDPIAGRFAAGFFTNPTTPTDFTTLPASPEFEFACLNQQATYH